MSFHTSIVTLLALTASLLPALSTHARTVASEKQPDLRYTNPVLPKNAPDPHVLYVKPYYYLYATNTLAHEGWGWTDRKDHWMPIFRSPDLVNWTHIGNVFTEKPGWVGGEGLWAPDVHYWKGKYWMYYSTSGAKIGLATADRPEGPWTDIGKPFLTGVIDPHVFIDRGKRYFVWGSFYPKGEPIHVQELGKDGLTLTGKRTDVGTGEGAYVLKRDGYYYLLQSHSPCCEENSNYHVTVSRSRSLFGPYLDREGKPTMVGETILKKNEEWAGPGHLSIATDAAGKQWAVYHAIKDGEYRKNGRWLLIDPLIWKDGWPIIGEGVPSTTSQPAPRIGKQLSDRRSK